MVDYNPFDEDEKKPGQTGQEQTTMAPTTPVIGQSGALQTQTVGGMGTGGQSQQTGSGRFTNIQKYLKASQGNQLGQQLGQRIQKEAQSPLSQIGAERGRVQEQLAGEIGTEPGKEGRLTRAPQLFGQVQQDVTGLTPEQVASFQRLYQGQAQAPAISNLAQIQAGAQKTQDLAKLAGSEGGRFQLLNQFYGRPTYSTGQQRLDQLLLQAQPSQAQGLQQAATGASQDVQKQLSALRGYQSEGMRDVARQAAERQAEAQTLLGQEAVGEETGTGLLGGLVDTIEGRAGAEQTKSTSAYEALKKAFGPGFESAEEQQKALAAVQATGIDPTKINVYDLASQQDLPRDFLRQINISPEQIATQEERAKLAALSNLAGRESTFLTGESGEAADLSKMLDVGRLGEITAARRGEYESELAPYLKTQQSLSPLVDLEKQLAQISANEQPILFDPIAIRSGEFNRQQQGYRQSKIDAINAAAKKGLSADVVQELMGAKGLRESYAGGGMRAEAADVPSIFKKYLGQLSEAEKQISTLPDKYGAGTTLADLLNRYKSLKTQTGAPQASGPSGRMGIL